VTIAIRDGVMLLLEARGLAQDAPIGTEVTPGTGASHIWQIRLAPA
jgi:hypothetical protein